MSAGVEFDCENLDYIKMGNWRSNNPIVEKSYAFALGIMDFAEQLDSQRKYSFANQVLRSGTSVGANIRESQMAESKQDFIHKMSIAAKEADETNFWLSLCRDSPHYPNPGALLLQSNEIAKILHRIIKTTKDNLDKRQTDN